MAMFLLAFHTLLRVGELCGSKHALKLSDIPLQEMYISIFFRSYKFCNGRCPSIFIPSSNSILCLVRALQDYLNNRGTSSGWLFVDSNGNRCSTFKFRRDMASILHSAGMSDWGLTPHSFRVGAATSVCLLHLMTMAPDQVHILNIMMPICPDLVQHPLFMTRVDALHRRIVDVVMREIGLIAQEPVGDPRLDQETGAVRVVRGEARGRDSGTSVQLSDDQVTISAPEDDAPATAAIPMGPRVAVDRPQPSRDSPDDDVVIGVRIQSPPRRNLSSDPDQVLLTEAARGFSSTRSRAMSVSSSDDSSLPDLHIVNKPHSASASGAGPSTAPVRSLPPSRGASTTSLFSSASQGFSFTTSSTPIPPPPLANVSWSDIDSPLTHASVAHAPLPSWGHYATPSIRPSTCLALRRHVIRRVCQRRRSPAMHAAMQKVARWLLLVCEVESESDGSSLSLGSPNNLIYLSDNSDSDSE